MWYHYESSCIEIACEECPRRLNCVNYTPREEYPPEEEYRGWTPLDDTRGELIRGISGKISSLGYPRDEIYKLVILWLAQGWQARDLLILVRSGVHPLLIENILREVSQPLVKSWLISQKEIPLPPLLSEEEEEEENNILLPSEEEDDDIIESGEIPDSILLEWAVMAHSNFTGEVRLGPPEEFDGEDNLPLEKFKEFKEAERLCLSVSSAVSGKRAYELSCRVKELLQNGDMPSEWRAYLQKLLRRAWEVRKTHSQADPSERLKILRASLKEE